MSDAAAHREGHLMLVDDEWRVGEDAVASHHGEHALLGDVLHTSVHVAVGDGDLFELGHHW